MRAGSRDRPASRSEGDAPADGSPAVAVRSALLLGATGLVGGHCLRLLLADPVYGRVHALVRRSLGHPHPGLVEHVVDFDRLERHTDAVRGDDVFCCLGTTIGKAGSREAFLRVDHGIPLQVGRMARANGARTFLLVSALGADAGSRIFYNRAKGEVERDAAALGFAGLVVLRPSLLVGERAERRKGEEVGKRVMGVVGPLLVGPLRRYRAIRGETVARAMVALAKADVRGVRIVESDEIERIGA
ncbi:MAG: nucleoside-diphosphate sugar epimerase [Gemmatimonadetes bacterium]|nr:nucleoside-diphosphate sugar epimerase [Gemmatimonadota bacterium]